MGNENLAAMRSGITVPVAHALLPGLAVVNRGEGGWRAQALALAGAHSVDRPGRPTDNASWVSTNAHCTQPSRDDVCSTPMQDIGQWRAWGLPTELDPLTP